MFVVYARVIYKIRSSDALAKKKNTRKRCLDSVILPAPLNGLAARRILHGSLSLTPVALSLAIVRHCVVHVVSLVAPNF